MEGRCVALYGQCLSVTDNNICINLHVSSVICWEKNSDHKPPTQTWVIGCCIDTMYEHYVTPYSEKAGYTVQNLTQLPITNLDYTKSKTKQLKINLKRKDACCEDLICWIPLRTNHMCLRHSTRWGIDRQIRTVSLWAWWSLERLQNTSGGRSIQIL